MFLTSGLIVGVLQLFVFPRVVKVLGIAVWQRAGCLLSVPAFVAISCVKVFGLSDDGMLVVSVAIVTVIYCCQGTVRE